MCVCTELDQGFWLVCHSSRLEVKVWRPVPGLGKPSGAEDTKRFESALRLLRETVKRRLLPELGLKNS